jgi:hypothetical protein
VPLADDLEQGLPLLDRLPGGVLDKITNGEYHNRCKKEWRRFHGSLFPYVSHHQSRVILGALSASRSESAGTAGKQAGGSGCLHRLVLEGDET